MKILIQIMVFLWLLSFAGVSSSCDMSELYRSNYHEFWIKWKAYKTGFEECSQAEETEKFFRMALKLTSNSEVMEANNEVIEGMTLKNPECVLNGLHSMEDSEMKSVLNFYIARPLLTEIDDIESALGKFWEDEKYSKIKEEFLTLKREIYK